MIFVDIPAGSFLMGDQDAGPVHPVHHVNIRPFQLGQFAVTNREYSEFDRDYIPDSPDNYPATGVSHNSASAFAAHIGGRLPTEAEWEYACRAGTTTRYWWGDEINYSNANYDINHNGTVPVDKFAPNPWGLYNMHGNVWEWCEDVWHDTYEGAPVDGSAWITGGRGNRVLRGGSWSNTPENIRSAIRVGFLPDIRFDGAGFRVAR